MIHIARKWSILFLFLFGPVSNALLSLKEYESQISFEQQSCSSASMVLRYPYGKISKWQLLYPRSKPDVEFSCGDERLTTRKTSAIASPDSSTNFLFAVSFFLTIAFVFLILVSPFVTAK